MMFKNQIEWDKLAKAKYLENVLGNPFIPFGKYRTWEELHEEEKNTYRSEVLKG